MSNCGLLKTTWPALSDLAELAERALVVQPRVATAALGALADLITRFVLAYESLAEPANGSQRGRLNSLTSAGAVPDTLLPLLHALRRDAEVVVREDASDDAGAIAVQSAHRLVVWFGRTYCNVAAVPFGDGAGRNAFG